jgi:DNA-binding MarR family transcriptional regulator
MERNDLVNRVTSATDKRSYQIVLTKYAKGIIEQLKAIEEATLQKATAGLNPIEVKELIRMLEHLYEKLD